MNIIVCIKAVKAELVNENRSDDAKSVINPYDLNALEKVIELKNKKDINVKCLSMGPQSIKETLVRCLAIGADDVIWLNDAAFAASDTVATSYILYETIKKEENVDLIVCGACSVDGETGQVGIGISERLHIPCVTGVDEIISVTEHYVILRRSEGQYEEIIKIYLPALVIFRDFSIKSENINLLRLKKAQKRSLDFLTANDLKLDISCCGLAGSKTKVISIKQDLISKESCLIDGDLEKKTKILSKIIGGEC